MSTLTVTQARMFNTTVGKSVAFAQVTLNDELQLTGLKIIEGMDGLFVSYPKDGTGTQDYKSVYFPLTKKLRDYIEETLLKMHREGKSVLVDTSDRPIKVGDEVSVEPYNDCPPHEFTGTVTEIRPNDHHGTEYLVEDSEGDTFNCNLTQLNKETND